MRLIPGSQCDCATAQPQGGEGVVLRPSVLPWQATQLSRLTELPPAERERERDARRGDGGHRHGEGVRRYSKARGRPPQLAPALSLRL